MPILSGFPPSNQIAPGIKITEVDQTLILPAPSFHRAGLVGFASKGPVNIPTLITSIQSLNKKFGFPHPQTSDPYLIYAATQYLNIGNSLYVVRVAQDSPVSDEQAVTASVEIPGTGGLVNIISNTAGPYVFSTENFFRWRLNGNLASKVLVVLAGTYTTDQLVSTLNGQLTASTDGIQFFNSNGNIAIESVYSYGPSSSIELVSVQSSMYGGSVAGGNVTGLGVGMTQASLTGTVSKYPNTSYQTSGYFNFTGLTGLNLLVVVSGTNNTSIDDIVQTIDLSVLEGQNNSLAAVIDQINSSAVGFQAKAVGNNLQLYTLAYGEDSQMLVKSTSTAATILGLATTTVSGTSPSGVTGDATTYNDGIVTGNSNASTTDTFQITADSPGIEGNNTQVVIDVDAASGTFSFSVFSNGAQVEQWGGLTKNQSSSFYAPTYLQQVSNFIEVVDNTNTAQAPLAGTYSLSGGTDGIPADPDTQDTLLIGNSVAQTGLQALSDPDQVDIDLIAIPGHPSTACVQALIDFCENKRQDCFAIIDPPFGLTPDEVVDWQQGTHPLNLTQLDSDFAALYWPWVSIYDTTNLVNVWCPPSGSVMATYAYSDNIGAPWEAPAGLTRGIVSNINNVFSRPSSTQRDEMYSLSNAINPIVQFSDVNNFVIWGQKTLQLAPTALNRVNVRRMLLTAEKEIRAAVRTLIFEPNDTILQQKFVSIASKILSNIQANRGLTAFTVQCDASLNTPDVVQRNELRANVGIVPTYAAEFIYIQFTLQSPTG